MIQQRQAGGGSRGGSGTHLSQVDVLLLLLVLLGPLLQLAIRPLHNDPGATGGACCLQTHRGGGQGESGAAGRAGCGLIRQPHRGRCQNHNKQPQPGPRQHGHRQ